MTDENKFKVATLLASMMAGFGMVSLQAADSTEKVTYVDDVFPVLENSCLNCHNPDKAKGGLDLTSYSATMAGGSGGKVVEPGNPGSSRLFTLTSHAEKPHMPPEKPKIDDEHLAILEKWIKGGVLETKGSKAKKTEKMTLAKTVEITGARPENPAMPEHVLLEPEVVTERGNAITALAASPWAPLVAVGGQKQVLLYHTETLELLGVLAFPEGFPESLSFSRNGSLLLVGGGRGGKSGKAVAFDVKTGERVVEVGREYDTALAADISPDHRLVTLGGPGRNIKVYDTQSGEQLHSIKKHPDWLLEVEFSPDGVLFASGGRNGGLYVWESHSGIQFYELKEHQKAVTGISWRADSNVLAACSEDGQISLWEMKSGKQIRKWNAHGGGALAIDFSPDGSRIVSAGRDQRVKVWDLNGKVQQQITGFRDLVTAVTYTHDGEKVISGDWYGQVTVWNAKTGSEIGKLLSNPPPVTVQLKQAQQIARELEKRLPGQQKAASAAEKALAEARKKREAAAKAVAQVKKDRADAEQLAKKGNQMMSTAKSKVSAAEKAHQSARNSLNEAKTALEKAKNRAAALRKEVEKLAGEIAPLETEKAAADQRFAALQKNAQKLLAERNQAAKKLEGAEFELDQLPGNADIQKKVTQARSARSAAEKAYQEADKQRKAMAEKRQTLAQSLTKLMQSREAKARELKAAELLVSEHTDAHAKASQALKTAESKLAEARKLEQTAKGRVDEAKKLLANYGNLLKKRENEHKQATDALKKAEQRHGEAKKALAQTREELDFARYQIDKWQAAQVNLTLHAEEEELGTYREQYIRLEGRAKEVVEEHESAAQALAQARQTLNQAKKVIQDGNRFVDSATDQVVETGLKALAARLVEEESTVSEMPVEIPDSQVEAIAARAPDFQKELQSTAAEVQKTLQEVEKASKTARETPAVIEERAKFQAAKEAEMKEVLDQVRNQEKRVEEKTKSIEELRKQYEKLYREWGANEGGQTAAK